MAKDGETSTYVREWWHTDEDAAINEAIAAGDPPPVGPGTSQIPDFHLTEEDLAAEAAASPTTQDAPAPEQGSVPPQDDAGTAGSNEG